MHNLVTAELAFCKEIETGLETYVHPLKTILSSSSHRKIFQGIPKVGRGRGMKYTGGVAHEIYYRYKE